MSKCWKYTFPQEWLQVGLRIRRGRLHYRPHKLQHQWNLILISNYQARVQLSFSLPHSLTRNNISKLVCSFVGQKTQITHSDLESISMVRSKSYVQEIKFYTYCATFEFYFKHGIYHTIFYLHNGKFNYDIDVDCVDYNSNSIRNKCELKFKIYLKMSRHNLTSVKIRDISRDMFQWMCEMSSSARNYTRYPDELKHNCKTETMLRSNLSVGYRMCLIYKQNNIVIGLNPFMEYYEQTRNMIEKMQYNLVENEYCATDISWIDILFEYITFVDFESNCGILNDKYDYSYNNNTAVDDYHDKENNQKNHNDKDYTAQDTCAVTDYDYKMDPDDITDDIDNDKYNCSTDCNHMGITVSDINYNVINKLKYHRNTLDSITDGRSVYDTVGFRRVKGLKYGIYVYYYNNEPWCRACIIFEHKPNVVSSCVLPVDRVKWHRFHPYDAYLSCCELETQRIPFSNAYPTINSQHKKNFKIWLTDRDIVEDVDDIQRKFEQCEAVTNKFDFDEKYNSQYDIRCSYLIEAGHSRREDTIYKDRWMSVEIDKKYKNSKRCPKKKWTRTGYFDKKSNVKYKHLRKQKYKDNFKHNLHDYQWNKWNTFV